MEFEFSKEFLDRFKFALNDRDALYIRNSLDGVRSADICEILTEIGLEYSKYVFDIISPDIAADILVELEEDFRVEFMEYLSINELAYFIEILDSDDGADILNKMSFQRREKILEQINNEEKVGHLSHKLSQISDKADEEQSLIKIKDQQIEKLQQALDQEQELNVIGQRNMENLSNQIEAQRQQLEEWKRLTPLMARLRAAFLTE